MNFRHGHIFARHTGRRSQGKPSERKDDLFGSAIALKTWYDLQKPLYDVVSRKMGDICRADHYFVHNSKCF